MSKPPHVVVYGEHDALRLKAVSERIGITQSELARILLRPQVRKLESMLSKGVRPEKLREKLLDMS